MPRRLHEVKDSLVYTTKLSPVYRHFPLLILPGHARMTGFVAPPFFRFEEAPQVHWDPMNKPQSARLVFLDLLRGWAILFMMETHVFNTLLRTSLKSTRWFGYLTFINGLVAPSFLFVSGWVFMAGCNRKLEDFRAFGPAFRSQLGRIFLIWGLGYALHFPFYSYSRTKAWTSSVDWLNFCQMDILHCIALGLLLLFVSRIAIKDDRFFKRTVLTSSIVIITVSPLLGRVDFLRFLPAPIALYFQEQSFSYFPLFPWLGFLLLGAVTAMTYLSRVGRGNERELMVLVGLVGLECVLAGIVFWDLPNLILGTSIKVTANPFFFTLRLGCVMLLLFGGWQFARKWPGGANLVRELSRESLLVYVLHILIVYRVSENNRSLSSAYGESLTLWQSIAILTGLVFLMWMAASAWTSVKHRSQRNSRRIACSTAFLALLLFFLN